ncbi:aspartate/glutamate racemase family protein [Geofilum sp. OHC36d9]|uniref:aspartate/glutamate racemase family protein n=1 Tax=Geofilum sp. OHC36d9 TaxID=3458413 RepID=UPI004033D8B8
MKKIGILGGLGPEATSDYYKELINGFNALNSNGSLDYPEIVIYSVTMSKFIGLLETNRYGEAADYLIQCLNGIKNAGADFAVISANTPHLLFSEIQAKVDLPLISIVDVCAKEAQSVGAKRCGLLGTKFTMNNDFYQKVFSEYNIEVIVPDEQQIEFIHSKLFQELELGIFKDKTKQELLEIVADMKEKQQIDAVILGCTEFPLMFTDDSYCDLPFLNTTRIHVNAIINACLKSENDASK